MDNLIILSNENQIPYINKLQEIKQKCLLITLTDSLKTRLKEQYFCHNFDIYSYNEIINNNVTWEDCLEQSKCFFTSLGKLDINRENIFHKILGYNNISFLDLDEVRYLSAHSEFLANLIYKTSIIESILHSVFAAEKKIIIANPESEWDIIIELVCSHYNIKFEKEKKWRDFPKLASETKFITYKFKTLKSPLEIKVPLYFLPYLTKLKMYLKLIKCLVDKKDSLYSKKEILFFVINKKYMDVIIPLVKSIENDYRFRPLVLIPSNFDALNMLNENNISYNYIDSYITGDLIKESSRIYSNTVSKYSLLKKRKEFKDMVYTFEGLNLEVFLSPEIEKTIFLSMKGILSILLIMKIIDSHNAKVLFMPHFSENIVKSFIKGCRLVNVPTIGLHRGTATLSAEYGIFDGDRLLVAGKHSEYAFNRWGVDKNKIIITGLPIFDDLLIKTKSKDNINSIVRKKLNIPLNYYIVTYLTQSEGGRFGFKEKLSEVKSIFKVISGFENVYLVIKVHPTENNTDIYQKVAIEVGLNAYTIIRSELPLDDLLLSSRLAITKNSTAGFNALIAGCPLIAIGFHDDLFEGNFFVESDVAFPVRNEEELYMYLKYVFADNYSFRQTVVSKFLEDHFYKLDGLSINRIKQVIYSYL